MNGGDRQRTAETIHAWWRPSTDGGGHSRMAESIHRCQRLLSDGGCHLWMAETIHRWQRLVVEVGDSSMNRRNHLEMKETALARINLLHGRRRAFNDGRGCSWPSMDSREHPRVAEPAHGRRRPSKNCRG